MGIWSSREEYVVGCTNVSPQFLSMAPLLQNLKAGGSSVSLPINVVVEALNLSVERAKDEGVIRGVVSNAFWFEDQLFVVEEEQLQILRQSLQGFQIEPESLDIL